MLLSGSLVGVVWDVELHEFVQTSEAVPERCIFDPLLVSDDIVIERFQAIYRVYQEVPVAGDLAHWVVEERYLHDLWQCGE